MWWQPVLHESLKPWAEKLFTEPIVRVRHAIKAAVDANDSPHDIAFLRSIEKGVGSSATLLDVLKFVFDAKATYRAKSDIVMTLASEVGMAFYVDPETDPVAIESINREADKTRQAGDDWLVETLNTTFRDVVGLRH